MEEGDEVNNRKEAVSCRQKQWQELHTLLALVLSRGTAFGLVNDLLWSQTEGATLALSFVVTFTPALLTQDRQPNVAEDNELDADHCRQI